MRAIDAISDAASFDEAGSIIPGRDTVAGHIIELEKARWHNTKTFIFEN